MKLPRKINIYGTDYKIIQRPHVITSDGEAEGAVNVNERLIIIKSVVSADEKMATLLHECFHACLHETGITLCLEHAQEEHIVEVLARFVPKHFNVRPKKA